MGLSSYARYAGYLVMFCDLSPGLRLGLPSFARDAGWKLWGCGSVGIFIPQACAMWLSSYARYAGYLVMFCDQSPGLRLGLRSFARYAGWKLWGAGWVGCIIIWGMKP